MADLSVNKSDSIRLHEDAGQNLVVNGDFENAPSFTAATTTNAVWIDGTAGGSATNSQFGWGTNRAGSFAAQFDNTVFNSGSESMKLSTTATASSIEARPLIGTLSLTLLNGGAIPAYSSTQYTLTHYMKTNFTSGAATTAAKIQVREYNSAGSLLTTTSSPTTGIQTTTNFTLYTKTFTTNASTVYILVVPLVSGNDGTATLIMDAWFDDINLVATSRALTGSVSADLNPTITPATSTISGPKIWS